MSVFIVGLSYGARNILLYTRRMMQNCLAFKDSPIIPLRRSSGAAKRGADSAESAKRERESRSAKSDSFRRYKNISPLSNSLGSLPSLFSALCKVVGRVSG